MCLLFVCARRRYHRQTLARLNTRSHTNNTHRNTLNKNQKGTYDGISFHPYETVFVKASWHVADPYTRRYSAWHLGHQLGRAGTEGAFDDKMYRYAISEAAQHPKDLEGAYHPFRV